MRAWVLLAATALAGCGPIVPAVNGSKNEQASATNAAIAAPARRDDAGNTNAVALVDDPQSDADALRDYGEPSGKMPHVGQCFSTTVKEVTSRLEGAPESGTDILFEDGHNQVSYDIVPEAERAKAGDPVKMCVSSIPDDCPPNDFRGVVYRTLDLRTGEVWDMPNAEHRCGGA